MRMRSLTLWLVFQSFAAGPAAAQAATSCQDPVPPSVGFAVGKSSPYIEFARSVVEAEPGSVSATSGASFTGRADVSPAGIFRLRVEASTARWSIRRKIYDPNTGYQLVADVSEGDFVVRSFVGTAGFRLGRPAVCAHVLFGGGIFALDYLGTKRTRPGSAIIAGLEMPTGTRGVIQIDARLHIIHTRGLYSISSTEVLDGGVTAGWAFRFN